MKKYYLAEPVEVTESGNIKGKTLRTYELTLEQTTLGSAKTVRNVPKTTGVMFTVKDGKIVSKSTNASLNNKYLGWNSATDIHEHVTSISSYRSSLFTTPEAALISKYITLRAAYSKAVDSVRAKLYNIEKAESQLPNGSALIAEYPELLI